MSYGFSLFRNPADVCRLAVPIESRHNLGIREANLSVEDGSDGEDIAALSQKGQAEQDLHWVRLIVNSACAKQQNQSAYEFSPHFLQKCSKMFANKREVATSCFFSQASIDFFGGQLSRNTLHLLCAVIMILQKQQQAITQHNYKLPKWPESTKAFHAARYRRNQVHLLNVLTEHFLQLLHKLGGIKSFSGRNERLVRLEHILTQSPPGLMPDFRAALHAGLGTRNPAKIRSKGWVECAFTLWLCGLWLWRITQNRGVDDSQDPIFISHILSWLSFLERVYGCPDVIKADEEIKFQSTKENEDMEMSPQARNPDFQAQQPATDDVSIAKSYLAVVEAALRKNPQSLYGSPNVTTARLVWCLNIIREEGMMAPNLDGKTGEEDDEFILFLENGNP